MRLHACPGGVYSLFPLAVLQITCDLTNIVNRVIWGISMCLGIEVLYTLIKHKK